MPETCRQNICKLRQEVSVQFWKQEIRFNHLPFRKYYFLKIFIPSTTVDSSYEYNNRPLFVWMMCVIWHWNFAGFHFTINIRIPLFLAKYLLSLHLFARIYWILFTGIYTINIEEYQNVSGIPVKHVTPLFLGVYQEKYGFTAKCRYTAYSTVYCWIMGIPSK